MDDGLREKVLRHMLDTIYYRYVADPGAEVREDPDLSYLAPNLPDLPEGYRCNDVAGVMLGLHTGTGYQRVRRILESLVSGGILVKGESKNGRNRALYYPNETEEGYLALIRDERNDAPLRGSRYQSVMLSRQLVLDRLKEANVTFTVSLESPGTGITYAVSSALVGRYQKVCEDQGPLMDFQDRVMRIRDDMSPMSDKQVFRALMPELGDKADEADTEGWKDENLRFIDRLVDACDDFLGECQMYQDEHRDYTQEQAFVHDRKSILRREAWGTGLQLTGAEEKALISLAEDSVREHFDREVESGKSIRSGDRESDSWFIGKWFGTGYPQFVDEEIVLPILALVSLSPSARRFFFLDGEWPQKWGVFFSDAARVRSPLTWELFRLAVKDVVDGRSDISSEVPLRLTNLGNTTIKGVTYDSLMAFILEDGRHLLLYGGKRNRLHADAADPDALEVAPLADGINAQLVGRRKRSPMVLRLLNTAGRYDDYRTGRLWGALRNEAMGYKPDEEDLGDSDERPGRGSG